MGDHLLTLSSSKPRATLFMMSEHLDSKPYCFPGLEDQDGASACRAPSSCSSMSQLHCQGGYSPARADHHRPSKGFDSSAHQPQSSSQNLHQNACSRLLPEEDMELKSVGSSGSGTESHGDERYGNDSQSNDDNDSHGNDSQSNDGNDSQGNESQGNDSQGNDSQGNDSQGNENHGHESLGSSNGNSKDSALLESSGSNKSSDSHSPSPQSSSNAFSLLSSEQDNPPSSSVCSSQETAKAKTQKEVINLLKELKFHLPHHKSANSKSSTLSSLKYALRCVRQLEANKEFYQLLMVNDSQPSGLDVSSYTTDDIDSITSEYTQKNNDIFAVAVSVVTGRIVYISEQAASILNCKMDIFKNSKFVEFLTPQDVSVFYSFTMPYRLPSWSMYTGAEAPPPDCMQEKSFFCRISGGKECEGDLQFFPFRMTPYLMKVQNQFCCLLLAERVHSGYEAPRIPMEKQIFTTKHTPSCVFQDVDERAVHLLGYLPQDLIGTPLLRHLHPDDRSIMLAIHRRIYQCAGQPFDHSSIRFCARNGEYIMLDTSWSSFINPWSRKVSLVIGRHKVRMGPVNEDVFLAPPSTPKEVKTIDSGIQEVTEQIHRLLLQPVLSSASSGYSSLNSNKHLLMTSSSESINNGTKMQSGDEDVKARPQTFQEICNRIHLQKSQESQANKAEHGKPHTTGSMQKSLPAAVRPKDSAVPLSWWDAGTAMEEEELNFNDQAVYSYQQISCLDNVIRYLESCNIPITIKRKCLPPLTPPSSNSDEEKQKDSSSLQTADELKNQTDDHQDRKSRDPVPGVEGTSLPLPVPNKPESVVSLTSQCSYSSTIVHVGDKKLKPESETIEDLPAGGEMTECGQNPTAALFSTSPPAQEKEAYKKLGLTKEVLASHTQKEEQIFLSRFRELGGLSAFKANCSQYLEQKKEQITQKAQVCKQAVQLSGSRLRRGIRNKKTKSKRMKPTESSGSTASSRRQQVLRPPLLNHGLNQTSWSPSDTSQSAFPTTYPAIMPEHPEYPLQDYPRAHSTANVSWQGFEGSQAAQVPLCPPAVAATAFSPPMVNPFLALVMPNYLYPMMASPGLQTLFTTYTGALPIQALPFSQAALTVPPPFHSSYLPPVQNHTTGFSTPLFYLPPPPETPKPAAVDTQSRPTTPQLWGGGSQTSPQLFQSRCSSPLNLLELELSTDWQDSGALSSGGLGTNTAEREDGTSSGQATERELKRTSSHSDANSLSTDMLDIILQEDSCSGTGSATSGSMGSGSNGCGTSNSETSKSRTSASDASAGSNNSSKYFGSVDSSQNSQKIKGHQSSSEGDASDRLLQYVRRDPLWLLAANTDNQTYQLPSRDVHQVLKEDEEKLRLFQKNQPLWSEEQKEELMEVHPWIKKGTLPKAIDIKTCPCCGCSSEAVERTEVKDHLDFRDTETGDKEKLSNPVAFSAQSSHCTPDTTSETIS